MRWKVQLSPTNLISFASHGQVRRRLVRLVESKFKQCNNILIVLLNNPPEETIILLLTGFETYGRTGINLIEFLHALQYGRDKNVVVGIMQHSWTTHLITEMWMAVQDKNNMVAWAHDMEQNFCVKIFDAYDHLNQYKEVRRMETKDESKFLFFYGHDGSFEDYFDYQRHIIRTLWRSHNNGIGRHAQLQPVRDMCSALDAIFGNEMCTVTYSVVHSRSLERAGTNLMKMVSRNTGCDPTAALEMEPEYVKAILEPTGMLNYPIVFMTDHQRPDILERLLADPDIGSDIILIPSEATWIGGDITLATMANVFIGNPASSLSAFIVKSRKTLGYNNNYLFMNKAENGTWVGTCDHHCVFWYTIL
ncbi:hypothetical protein ACHAXH_005052 [Discostella pseudostelligera]